MPKFPSPRVPVFPRVRVPTSPLPSVPTSLCPRAHRSFPCPQVPLSPCPRVSRSPKYPHIPTSPPRVPLRPRCPHAAGGNGGTKVGAGGRIAPPGAASPPEAGRGRCCSPPPGQIKAAAAAAETQSGIGSTGRDSGAGGGMARLLLCCAALLAAGNGGGRTPGSSGWALAWLRPRGGLALPRCDGAWCSGTAGGVQGRALSRGMGLHTAGTGLVAAPPHSAHAGDQRSPRRVVLAVMGGHRGPLGGATPGSRSVRVVSPGQGRSCSSCCANRNGAIRAPLAQPCAANQGVRGPAQRGVAWHVPRAGAQRHRSAALVVPSSAEPNAAAASEPPALLRAAFGVGRGIVPSVQWQKHPENELGRSCGPRDSAPSLLLRSLLRDSPWPGNNTTAPAQLIRRCQHVDT